jgi:hypothetical protein
MKEEKQLLKKKWFKKIKKWSLIALGAFTGMCVLGFVVSQGRPIIEDVPEEVRRAEIELSGFGVDKNTKVKIYLNDNLSSEVNSDESGKFTFSISLSEGINTVYAEATHKDKIKKGSEEKITYINQEKIDAQNKAEEEARAKKQEEQRKAEEEIRLAKEKKAEEEAKAKAEEDAKKQEEEAREQEEKNRLIEERKNFDEKHGNNFEASDMAKGLITIMKEVGGVENVDMYLRLDASDEAEKDFAEGGDLKTYRNNVRMANLMVVIDNMAWSYSSESTKKDLVATWVNSLKTIYPEAGPFVTVNNGVRNVAEGSWSAWNNDAKIELK